MRRTMHSAPQPTCSPHLPTVIVAFHRPMYYGSTRDENFAQFEALLMQYQVDLVLTGHVHYAMVYCPIYQGACVTAPSPGECTHLHTPPPRCTPHPPTHSPTRPVGWIGGRCV